MESNSKIDTGDVIAYVGKKWEKRNTPKSADAEKIFRDGAVRQYRIDDSGYIRQFTRGNRNIGSTRTEDKSDSGFLSERGRSDSENESLYTGYLGEDYEKYENISYE